MSAATLLLAAAGAASGPLLVTPAALENPGALLEAGRLEAARELFETLARERPTPAVLNAQAVALLRGDPARVSAQALAALERAAELAPDSPAWREASQAVYLDPHRARAHLVLARCLRARGEDEAALSALRVALWAREDPAVRRGLVLHLEEQGRLDAARAEARALLALDPEDAVGRRVLGR